MRLERPRADVRLPSLSRRTAFIAILVLLGPGRASYPQERSSSAKPRITVNPKDGLTYVWIPAGSFLLGCSPDDSQCSDYERPQKKVTFAEGFWIGQTPVTQAAYKKVTGDNPSHFRGDQLPVETVTWDQAESYCEVVGMRLPREIEWEYAARGGTATARYGPLDLIAWYRKNSGATTHRVAEKKPNAYGLYDMLGNVDEWVSDLYNIYVDSDEDSPRTAPPSTTPPILAPPSIPLGASVPTSRVVRGASWDNGADSVTATNRNRFDPLNSRSNVGFRCVANSF
jgi:formylglycine-generating enzyme required for sulfatase activity